MPEAKTYKVLPNVGEQFTVEADKVEIDAESNRISMWHEGSLVASINGGSFHVV